MSRQLQGITASRDASLVIAMQPEGGGKMSGGSSLGGTRCKGKRKVSPPNEWQKLRIVTEVHTWQSLWTFTKTLSIGVQQREVITKGIMGFIYGNSQRDDEMVGSLDLTVAPFMVGFKKFVERNLSEKNVKLCSIPLATGYMAHNNFIETKVRT